MFHKLRNDIFIRCLSENDELREMTIEKELGVSRTPVREYVQKLELEGLIKTIRNKGNLCDGNQQKDIHDIFL